MDGTLTRKQGLMWMTIVVTAAVIALPLGYLSSFDAASVNIGGAGPARDYLIGLGWSLAILVAIAALPFSPQTKQVLLVLWIARIAVTMGFMLYYEAHYGLDAFYYYWQGGLPYDHWAAAGFGNGTSNIIALASLHNAVIPDSYHAIKVTTAAIGLLAVYLFYRSACLYLGRREPNILLALGLFPSILFWGSILGKDPFTLLGIALFGLGLVGFYKTNGISYLLLALVGIALAAWFRAWLLLIFTIPIGIFLLRGRVGFKRRVFIAIFAIPAVVWGSQIFQERLQIESSAELIERTDQLSQSWAYGGSAQEYEGVESLTDMVLFVPVGAFTALFRPLPGEVMNSFGLMAGFENAFILYLLTRAMISGRWRRMRDPVLAWVVCTLIVWGAIYGFVSFQNLGTAFRFKVQIMPMLVLLCFALTVRDETKLPRDAQRRPRRRNFGAVSGERHPAPV